MPERWAVCGPDRDHASEIVQQTSSRIRRDRMPSCPGGQAAVLRRDRIRFFAAPGYFGGAALQLACDPQYRYSLHTTYEFGRAGRALLLCGAASSDIRRLRAIRALHAER